MTRLLPLALLLLCGCGDLPSPDARRLQGEWIVTDFRLPSAAEDRGQRRNRAIVTEGTWSEQFLGARFEDFEYVIDESKSPKELDLVFTDANGRRLRVRAIYEFLDDDRVRVCLGTPPVVSRDGKPEYAESVRPTAFEPTAGPLIRYQRRADDRDRFILRW